MPDYGYSLTHILHYTQYTQGINWTYLGGSEDVLDVFWTSYVRSFYVLCLQGKDRNEEHTEMHMSKKTRTWYILRSDRVIYNHF